MAARPFAEKIFRLREGKLVDVTPEFCGTKDERLERGYLSREDLEKLASAGRQDVQDIENISSTLDARISQHVFCREYDDALKDINLWAPGKRLDVTKGLAEAFKVEYPEFVAKLEKITNKD
jgi:hypothetical protein